MRRVALVVLFVSELSCGGSSSETPPPLEPDPARLRRTAASDEGPPAGDAPAVVPALPPSAETSDEATRRGARRDPRAPTPPPSSSTWGGTAPLQPVPELAPEPEL